MKKITISAEVYDDFKKGMCYDCPFAYTEYWDDGDGNYGYRSYKTCVLGESFDNCPIEIVKEVEV